MKQVEVFSSSGRPWGDIRQYQDAETSEHLRAHATEAMNTDDWLLAALGKLEDAVERARSELAAAQEVLAPTRADRVGGVPLVKLAADLADRGAGPRHSVAAAFLDYERAVASLRAQVIQALVDEEHVSLAELARQMNLSRQSVTRIYKQATRDAPAASRTETP